MSFLDGYAKKLGVLDYLGAWNAATNSPFLASGLGQRNGYYIVSVDGSTTLDGVSSWKTSDWAIFNGSVWEKIDNQTGGGGGNGFIDAGTPNSNFDSLVNIDGGGV